MSEAPKVCLYCDGQGWNAKANTECGFCDNGKPLDTQADWDRTWGRVLDATDRLPGSEGGTDE